MSKLIQKFAVSLAAAGLVLAPVTAHANTRAGDNATIYSGAVSQPGQGRSAEGEGIASTGDLIAWILVALWATGIVVAAVEDDDIDNQSPGAN